MISRIKTIKGLFRCPWTLINRKGMISRLNSFSLMIHIMVCAHNGGSKLNHGLTLRIELEGRRDRTATWHQDISDTHVFDGDTTYPIIAILDTKDRVSWKTERIQKRKKCCIGKGCHPRNTGCPHIHNGKQNRIHASKESLQSDRTDAKTKEKRRDTIGKFLKHEINASSHRGDRISHRAHGLEECGQHAAELSKDRPHRPHVGLRMGAKDTTETEIKILFGVVSKETRKRHDHGTTSFIRPVCLDRGNVGQLTASKERCGE